MTTSEVKEAWFKHWKNEESVESVATPIGSYLRHVRLKILKNVIKPLDHNLSVLDMGCGTGQTLRVFREANFHRSIGIDYVPKSLDRCKSLGYVINKDVFLMDAGNTNFADKEFDIVFQEGMWEHFIDPEPYIKEASRVAKTYIIIVQPNHFSFFGRLMFFGWNLFWKKGVKEYSFRMSYFIDKLDEFGFELVQQHSTILKEQMILIFKRRNADEN